MLTGSFLGSRLQEMYRCNRDPTSYCPWGRNAAHLWSNYMFVVGRQRHGQHDHPKPLQQIHLSVPVPSHDVDSFHRDQGYYVQKVWRAGNQQFQPHPEVCPETWEVRVRSHSAIGNQLWQFLQGEL